jgi:hypothetical protein
MDYDLQWSHLYHGRSSCKSGNTAGIQNTNFVKQATKSVRNVTSSVRHPLYEFEIPNNIVLKDPMFSFFLDSKVRTVLA